MMRRLSHVIGLVVLLSTWGFCQFGVDKEYIRIYQRRLPAALLPADSLRLIVEPKGLTVSSDIADELLGNVRGLLSAGLPDLQIVSTNDAALVMDCSVEVFQITPSTFVHTELVYTKIGEHREYDAKKKEWKTKDDYANIPVDKTYVRLDGHSEVEYGLYDARTKKELDSDRVAQPFSWVQENDHTILHEDDVRNLMIQNLAIEIAGKVAPVGYPVKVKLAKNDKLKTGTHLLDEADDHGQPMPWLQAAKIWEGVNGLSSKDEPYRDYNLAVAYEGLGYETPDADASQQLLRKAADLYQKAQQLKPDEKYFADPLPRIQTAIADVAQLKQLQTERMAALRKPGGPVIASHKSPKVQNASAQQGAEERLSNKSIIELTKGGLADSVIIKKIKSSKCNFDTSTDALVSLRKAGVSNQVISAMVEAAE
jgi:hypothetical protein